MEYKRIARLVWRPVRALLVVAVLLLALVQLVGLFTTQPGVGHWRDRGSQQRYAEARRQTLSGLRAPTRTREVTTSFGTVRVLVWEAPGHGDPVLLVPGRSSGAAMWAENLPDWIGRRTLYAVDPIGDAGHSSQSVPLTGPADQGAWLAETVRALGSGPVHVVGHSFGGSVAAELALSHPSLVRSLSLVEPVAVIRPLPASTYLWATVLALPTPQSWKDRALARIGGTTTEQVQQRSPMSVMIDEASSGYSAALPLPRTFDDQQWRQLTMPLRVDIGLDSELAGGQASVDRLHDLRPEATVTAWPGGTHSLPMEQHERYGAALLGFWAAAEHR
ncbi:alpha/beta fold hydrolase [Luteococcus peritonei]|uniref:Alpha/beta fold hydrolase n=1 Tax=Luteococcus peritonei TaxID=88874 RepID=A0ABW4RS84_9ACTN